MARQSLPLVPTWYFDFSAMVVARPEPLKSYKHDPELVRLYDGIRKRVEEYAEIMRHRVKIPDYEIYEPFRTQILNAILQYPVVRIEGHLSVMYAEMPDVLASQIAADFPLVVVTRTPLPALLGPNQKPQEDAGRLGEPMKRPEEANLPTGNVALNGGIVGNVSDSALVAEAQRIAAENGGTPPEVAVITSVPAASAARPAPVVRRSYLEILAEREPITSRDTSWARRVGVHTDSVGTWIISEEDGLATCTWMFGEEYEPEVVASGVRLSRLPSAVDGFLLALAQRVEAHRAPKVEAAPEQDFEVVIDTAPAVQEPSDPEGRPNPGAEDIDALYGAAAAAVEPVSTEPPLLTADEIPADLGVPAAADAASPEVVSPAPAEPPAAPAAPVASAPPAAPPAVPTPPAPAKKRGRR